ncbi:MAG: hypothetical protein K2M56_01970 [Muribaculaceae bacterium]|nr:hypothetical protein [Muribaculaceae bacterium]
MPNLSFRAALPLLFAALSMPAIAQDASSATLPSDSADIELIPRTYLGETVMVPTSKEDYVPQNPSWWSRVRASGAIQTEFMVPLQDEALMTQEYDSKVLNNTYFDFTLNAPYVSAGARFQFTKWPLPGFDEKTMPGFAGWGVPYFWVTGKYKWAQITAGDFYEQFGSGLILRTYQERSLGVDNAIRGGRVKLNPGKGLYFTALVGKERRFWEHTPDLIWGGDAEWSLNESFSNAFGPNYGLTLGFSYVGKHDHDNPTIYHDQNQYRLNFPTTIAAFDGRIRSRLKSFDILAEFATKNNDPNYVNNYIYSRGHVELLSLSYAAKGFSAYIQAKRSENMAFMSDQSVETNAFINYLPAFTNTQTYTLAALYPYATDYNGEWAFQAELRYLFKRNTPLGGKYGTNVKLSASYISDLADAAPLGPVRDVVSTDGTVTVTNRDPEMSGTDGKGSAFWKIGGLRYADLNFEISKKFSRTLQFTFFYLFQKLNYAKIFGHTTEYGHDEFVTANTFILEGQWKMAKKTQLRAELQYLTTKQDEKDWISALVEVSFAPHWMVTLTDTKNFGGSKHNYYSGMVTYVYKANRFSLSYGRTRAGFNCSGGVCRWTPATKGFSLTYNYAF